MLADEVDAAGCTNHDVACATKVRGEERLDRDDLVGEGRLHVLPWALMARRDAREGGLCKFFFRVS